IARAGPPLVQRLGRRAPADRGPGDPAGAERPSPRRGCVGDEPGPCAGRVACSAEMAVTVTLPDGKALELQDGATGADAAAAIGAGLARAALAVEVSHPEAGE